MNKKKIIAIINTTIPIANLTITLLISNLINNKNQIVNIED